MSLLPIAYKDIVLPQKLYKYRNWSDKYDKRLLTHAEAYFAPHKSFKERSELNLPQDYSNIDADFLDNWIFEDAMNRLQMPPSLARRFADFWMTRTPFENEDHKFKVEQDFQEDLNNKYGILSMTTRADNQVLWEDFSYDEGFVVGVNPTFMFKDELIQCTAGVVEYYPEMTPPKVKVLSRNKIERTEQMMITTFSLPDDFEEEEEYRLVKYIEKTGRQFKIQSQCVEEVLIAESASKATVNEISEEVEKKFPNCKLFRQRKDTDSGEMHFDPI